MVSVGIVQVQETVGGIRHSSEPPSGLSLRQVFDGVVHVYAVVEVVVGHRWAIHREGAVGHPLRRTGREPEIHREVAGALVRLEDPVVLGRPRADPDIGACRMDRLGFGLNIGEADRVWPVGL